MKILRVLLLASAVGAGSVITATAQQAGGPAQQADGPAPSPEAIAAAKELITIMSPDIAKDMNDKMFRQMWPPMEQSLRNQFPQLDEGIARELNDAIRAQLEKELVEQATALMDVMPAIYARHLTLDDMRAIQAFYRTPVGAKTLKAMPEIMGEATGTLNPRLQSMMERINVTVVDILQKHGYGSKK
jgi:uncharacterized protein